ncbi:hypothetical protein LI154_17980, partial [[Clostridium] scindens]|nr:hypothetical protein [[Clostridium] scindens]
TICSFLSISIIYKMLLYSIGSGFDLWIPDGYYRRRFGNSMRPDVFTALQYLLFFYPQCDTMQDSDKRYTVGFQGI